MLDLDGDGEFSVVNSDNSQIYFDYMSENILVKTSWIGGSDGVLIYDKNNDGIINSSSELFGNFTLKDDDGYTEHGFEALGLLDSNGDKFEKVA